ncbi:MAG: DUF1887 family CARF protein [Melioribacteraceae bacterium]
MKVLFQLVSGQVIPNITAHDYINPDEVVYFYTKQSVKELNQITNTLNQSYKQVEIDAFDYSNIYNKISEALKLYLNSDTEICLNFTNGTKIMSTAAYNLFSEFNLKRIYINSENYEILEFQNHFPVKSNTINSLIDIDDIFSLHGHKIKSKTDPDLILINDNYKTLYEFLKDNFKSLSSSILNFAAKYDKNKLINFFRSNLIILFNNNKVSLTLKNKNNSITINNEDINIIQFLRGDWFEYYCYQRIKELNIFDKLYINVQIAWKNYKFKTEVKNQIDIFGIKGTIPYAIECKSGSIKQEAIGQLAAIKNEYFDRYTKLILISYFNTNPQMIEKTIGNNDIKHITINNINELKTEILKPILKLR